MEHWDANRMNEIFIQKANSRNPERYLNKPIHEAFNELREIEDALRDIYHSCARNCWKKESLFHFLDNISPKLLFNKSNVYAETYISEAKIIKELILTGKLHN